MDDTLHQGDEADQPSLCGPQGSEQSAGDGPLLRLVLEPGGMVVELTQPDTPIGRHSGADIRLPLRLNQLKFYLRAVANAVLDYKMHCAGMTDAEALKFLVEDVYQSEGEAAGKVVRAKQSSCQLSTYFVGRMAFYRLRQQVQREQGDRFELGRYHEAVLDHGTLPVKYLPELVRERLKQPR